MEWHTLAFNLGIEVAQLLVVAGVLLVSYIFVQRIKIPRNWWIRTTSFVILISALKMAIDRLPF